MKNISEIKSALDSSRDLEINASLGDSLEELMQHLVTAGFVTPHYAWSIKIETKSTEYVYRLSDNYIRFYVKYIESNIADINTGHFEVSSLASLPGWNTKMGLHVENLLLNNRKDILKVFNLTYQDIVADNPYIQRTSSGERGCQIDYLIQTHHKNLFICEFKFNKNSMGSEIITEIQEKIERFAPHSGFGVFPILFHLGDISQIVRDKKYIYKIINIADFLGY